MNTSPSNGNATPHSMEASILRMLLDELECPICTFLMVGQRIALLCANGHPCCSFCSSRVSTCPFCRCEVSWSLCLPLKHIGSWLLAHGIVHKESPQTDTPPTRSIQRRSARRLRMSSGLNTSFMTTFSSFLPPTILFSRSELSMLGSNPSSPTAGGSLG